MPGPIDDLRFVHIMLLFAALAGCRTGEGTSIASQPADAGSSDARATSGPDRAAIADRLGDARPGEEREIGEGVFLKAHRIQATEPIGNGWHRAASTEGGFSVELPLAFSDVRIRLTTADKVEARSHIVGAKTPGLLSWGVMCMVRRDGKLGPEPRAPEPEKTERKGTTAIQRTIEFDDMSCILIVEAQGTDPLPAAADSERFLRSFKRAGKPLWSR